MLILNMSFPYGIGTKLEKNIDKQGYFLLFFCSKANFSVFQRVKIGIKFHSTLIRAIFSFPTS